MLTNNKIFNKFNKWVAIPLIVALIFATSVLSFSKLALPSSAASVTLSLTGLGTQADPYKIYNVSEFNNFRDYVNDGNTMSGKYIELMADIDYGDQINYSFKPIGAKKNNEQSGKKFSGTFNGNWKTISNMRIGGTAGYTSGLFGYLDNANISHLRLESITYISDGGYYVEGVGLLAGYAMSSTIQDIIVLDGSMLWVSSGVVGSAFGGIVGVQADGSITECYSYVDMAASGSYAGGIVGRHDGSGSITKCGNYGVVFLDLACATSEATDVNNLIYAGGIVGASKASISNCYNQGDVKSMVNYIDKSDYAALNYELEGGFAGGIAGMSSKAITNCYNTGEIVGGIENGHWYHKKCDQKLAYGPFNSRYHHLEILISGYEGSRASDICGSSCTIDNCYGVNSKSIQNHVYYYIKNESYDRPNHTNKLSTGSYVTEGAGELIVGEEINDNTYYFFHDFGISIKMEESGNNYSITIKSDVFKGGFNLLKTIEKSYTETTTASLKSALLTGFSSDVWAISPKIANGYPHIKGLYWEDYANI